MSEEILRDNERLYVGGISDEEMAELHQETQKPAHTVLAHAGDWQDWDGKDYKTHKPKGVVDVILRGGGRIYGRPAETLYWKHINRDGDIIAYRHVHENVQAGWILWGGNGKPPNGRVQVKLVCGAIDTGRVDDFDWRKKGYKSDIEWYRFLEETAEETQKPTNPKDTVGIKKAPMSTVSAAVMAEVGVAMMEGALKYGRHNYRGVGVRASVYYDATIRHLFSWWEGEDVDPDSGMSHITKAIASLTVLRDAMIQNKVDDDRPPRSEGFYPELNERAAKLIERYGHVNPHHYTLKDDV